MDLKELIGVILNKKYDVSFYEFLMDKYLSQDMTEFDSSRGINLLESINKDIKNVGKVNADDKKAFFQVLVSDYQKLGGNYQDLLKSINRENGIVVDSSILYGIKEMYSRKHMFILNVGATNLYVVLKSLYEEFKMNKLPLLAKIPKVKEQELGFSNAIVVYSSTEKLKETLDVLNGVAIKYDEFVNKPGELVISLNDNIGYQSITNGSTQYLSLICETFILGIDAAIQKYSIDNPKTLIAGQKLDSYLKNPDKVDIKRKNILLTILKSNHEFINNIIKQVHERMILYGIDYNYLFASFNTIMEIKNYYGIDGEIIKEESKEEILPLVYDFTKYAGLGEKDEYLERKFVNSLGEEMSVYEFLEQNRVLEVIPLDASVQIADGSVLSGKDFILFIVKNAERFAFEELMNIYVVKIDKKNNKKRFTKLFKN